ncbi:MAG: amidohydrolase [Gemmatimonadota bacterium]|nr:amidohydrolase [Gemmatimonadota bacterium]
MVPGIPDEEESSMNHTGFALLGACIIPDPGDGSDSVLIRGGRIEAVGNAWEIRQAAGDLFTLEVGGRPLSAGFHDAHAHFFQAGLAGGRLSLESCRSLTETLDLLQDALAADKGRGPFLAEAWDSTDWPDSPPARKHLDAVTSTRPVILRRVCGHIAVANTPALALLARKWTGDGIDPDSGICVEGPALAMDQLFPPGKRERRRAFQAAGDQCLQCGITTTTDFLSPDLLEMYRQEMGERPLPLRVRAYLVDPDAQAPDPPHENDRFRVEGIKLFADGSIGGGTAALEADYANAKGERGVLLFTDAELAEAVRAGHDAGRRVAVHAIGDRAIRQVLDAFAALNPEESRALGHRIEHFEMPSTEDMKRLRELGVRPCMQPNFVGAWGMPGGLYERALGSARWRRMNPLRSVADSGAGLFFGSDGMPTSPLFGIASAVGHPVESERLSPESALRHYTLACAEASGDSMRTGQIRPGFDADLVIPAVWPGDEPPEENESLLTILAGRVVHAAGPFQHLSTQDCDGSLLSSPGWPGPNGGTAS